MGWGLLPEHGTRAPNVSPLISPVAQSSYAAQGGDPGGLELAPGVPGNRMWPFPPTPQKLAWPMLGPWGVGGAVLVGSRQGSETYAWVEPLMIKEDL